MILLDMKGEDCFSPLILECIWHLNVYAIWSNVIWNKIRHRFTMTVVDLRLQNDQRYLETVSCVWKYWSLERFHLRYQRDIPKFESESLYGTFIFVPHSNTHAPYQQTAKWLRQNSQYSYYYYDKKSRTMWKSKCLFHLTLYWDIVFIRCHYWDIFPSPPSALFTNLNLENSLMKNDTFWILYFYWISLTFFWAQERLDPDCKIWFYMQILKSGNTFERSVS